MDAYEQSSATAGTGLSSSQIRVTAANSRPGSGGCTSRSMDRSGVRHAPVRPSSPVGRDFRVFAFEIILPLAKVTAKVTAKVVAKFLRMR
ncbi:hypothetical protein GCM10010353_51880 [Streptomyces chryseus]|nr:hypothetical protein GCM10010353_51880 [Streptomyces chryseus]